MLPLLCYNFLLPNHFFKRLYKLSPVVFRYTFKISGGVSSPPDAFPLLSFSISFLILFLNILPQLILNLSIVINKDLSLELVDAAPLENAHFTCLFGYLLLTAIFHQYPLMALTWVCSSLSHCFSKVVQLPGVIFCRCFFGLLR